MRYVFDYDAENDDLFVYEKGAKSKGSVSLGNLVLDFDYRAKLVGAEILDASSYLNNFVTEKARLSKDSLKKIKSCRLDFKLQRSQLIIRFFLELAEQPRELVANVVLPKIEGKAR